MATHDLKVWPEFFAALVEGTKMFEVRRNDRGFAVGDVLHLREWTPERPDHEAPTHGAYTGRDVYRTVSYVLTGHVGGSFGIYYGFCVLGLIPYVMNDAN